MERCRGTACGEWKMENGKWKVSQGCQPCVVGEGHAPPGDVLAVRTSRR